MKFVKDYACVFLRDISAIVIGDLHIGYEFELQREGINIAYTHKIKEDILVCKEKTKAKNIVLLGDTKHSIGIPDKKSEIEVIKDFFKFLEDNFENMFVVKGNHDGLLEKIVDSKKIKFYSSRGFCLSKYGFFHGNSYPTQKVLDSRIIFCSHAHPKFYLPEDKKYYEIRVYAIFKLKKEFGKNKKLVIVPPFSPIIAGKEISEVLETKNVIQKLVDSSEIEIYSIDCTKTV